MNVNKAGTDWLTIKGWLSNKIKDAHIQMEYPLTPEQYHAIRGSITMARELIEAVEPTTPKAIADDDYGISTM